MDQIFRSLEDFPFRPIIRAHEAESSRIMSKGQTDGDSSLSRRRRERATKSNRRSGILLASLVALAVAGAAWYWTQVAEPARYKESYKEETNRLFAVMKSKSNRLSKNSSE